MPGAEDAFMCLIALARSEAVTDAFKIARSTSVTKRTIESRSLRCMPSSGAGRAPPPDDGMQRKLLDSIVRFVTEVDRAILNASVTASDLASAIRHMKASSAPGMDGLTAGFYQ